MRLITLIITVLIVCRQQLQEVTANEIILLDKIKSLESEKGERPVQPHEAGLKRVPRALTDLSGTFSNLKQNEEKLQPNNLLDR